MSFQYQSREEMLWIRSHYRAHLHGVEDFVLSESTLKTKGAEMAPVSTVWNYAEPPSVTMLPGGLSNVNIVLNGRFTSAEMAALAGPIPAAYTTSLLLPLDYGTVQEMSAAIMTDGAANKAVTVANFGPAIDAYTQDAEARLPQDELDALILSYGMIWVQMDFGYPTSFNALVIAAAAEFSTAITGLIRPTRIQGSLDGKTWTDIARTSFIFSSDGMKVISTPNQRWRYVRLVADKNVPADVTAYNGSAMAFGIGEFYALRTSPPTFADKILPAMYSQTGLAPALAAPGVFRTVATYATMTDDYTGTTNYLSTYVLGETNAPVTLTMDLGSVRTIIDVVVGSASVTQSYFLYTQQLDIEGSTNGTSWTNVGNTEFIGPEFPVRTYPIAASYRYLRLVSTSRSYNPYAMVVLEFYARGPEKPEDTLAVLIASSYSQSSVKGGSTAANLTMMTNGSAVTYTETDGFGWLTMDMGAVTLVEAVVIGVPLGTPAALDTADLLGSNDNTNWTQICNLGKFIKDIQIYYIWAKSYRYFRIWAPLDDFNSRPEAIAVSEFYALGIAPPP
jgi:hypothetical protein